MNIYVSTRLRTLPTRSTSSGSSGPEFIGELEDPLVAVINLSVSTYYFKEETMCCLLQKVYKSAVHLAELINYVVCIFF